MTIVTSDKDPDEIVPVTFNFEGLTTAPQSPVISIVHLEGTTDANPAAMIVGSPQIVGGIVLQKITGGVDGAIYGISCRVDTAEGLRFKASGKLPVRTQ